MAALADEPQNVTPSVDRSTSPRSSGRPAARASGRRRPRSKLRNRGRELEAGQRRAAEPRGHRHRVAQAHVLAAEEVRLADPAAVERRDDAGRDVVDVDRRDPEVAERDVAEGAVVGALQLLADREWSPGP